MLFPSPQPGFTFWLRVVICFQSPFAPAHTSGGAVNELRTAADIFPSLEIEADGPHVPAET